MPVFAQMTADQRRYPPRINANLQNNIARNFSQKYVFSVPLCPRGGSLFLRILFLRNSNYGTALKPVSSSLVAIKRNRESGLAKPAAILLLLAAGVFLAGALRLARLGHFTLAQAAYCLLAIPAAMLLLLVFDYTFHHARIAALMVIAMLAVLHSEPGLLRWPGPGAGRDGADAESLDQ